MKKYVALLILPLLTLVTASCDRRQTPPPPSQTSDASDRGTDPTNASVMDADRSLQQKIRDTLKSDPQLSSVANRVTVLVQNRNVTLQGTVNSDLEKSRINDKIRRISGVSNVDNQLTVSGKQRSSSSY